MARPQNSARGLFAKARVDVGSQQVTYSATHAIFSGGITISNAQGITANSTGLVFGNAASALPGAVDNGVLVGVGSNSTGVFLFVNSTGTTHKYFNLTSVQPT